ncbi:MAG: DNA double-strand break repair nuclease NurA [Dehalococcoidia bacterium]|jgi:GNAT superfamily N-acetyltransferase
MSLDLTKVAAQVGNMVARLKASGEQRQKRLQSALNTLNDKSLDTEKLKQKIEASQTTWLLAGLVDGLNPRYKAPPLPADFSVLATDGSHIDVDRHQSTRCYLINIGAVALSYGANPDAFLDSTPALYFGEEDLIIAPANGGRPQPIEGTLLGIKRAVDECRRLAELAKELPKESEALALVDGSLILWGLAGETYPKFVTEALLSNGFLRHLEEIRKLNAERRLALASYISFPRSTDVVNSLRVALCPHDIIDTDKLCGDCKTRQCEAVAGVQDRELFESILEEGERSALFSSQSKIVKDNYGGHWVHFFYMRTDGEIARVEIPQWVARDQSRLELTHGLVLDQCRRGQGYPVALAEAHEQAVVTGADRENFWQLVESLMIGEHLPTPTSAKSFSKRTRWV